MARKLKVLTLDTIMTMGKYKGLTVAEVAEQDWTYIRWLVEKVWKGTVADEVSAIYR